MKKQKINKVDIHVVADYIIVKAKGDDTTTPLNNLKLQKLLYYTQAWHLVHYDQPLFDGEFQAWIHGPVNRIIFDRFKDIKTLYSEIELKDLVTKDPISVLTKEQKGFIDAVLEEYMKYTGSQLEELSHGETPWIAARKGYGDSARCEVVIDSEIMKEYYLNLLG